MNIFFIDNIDTLDKILKGKVFGLSEANIKSDILFVSARWNITKKLEANGLKYSRIDDFLSREDCIQIDKITGDLVRNWYKANNNKDFTVYNDISLGKLVEYDLILKFVLYFKFLAVFLKAIKQAEPEMIHHDFPLNSDLDKIITLINQKLFSKIVRINSNASFSPMSLSSFDFSSYPKSTKFNLKSLLRKWLNIFFGKIPTILNPLVNKYESNVLICGQLQIMPIFEKWLERKNSWGVILDQALSPPPRLSWALIKKGAKMITSPSFKMGIGCRDDFIEIIKNEWALYKNRDEYEKLFIFSGVSLQPLLEPYLDMVVNDRVPYLAELMSFYEEKLKKHKVKCIVLPNDCQEMMRLVVLVGEKIKIPALVIQHGILLKGIKFDNNHMTAQYSAFWSNRFRDEFVEEGLNPENTFVTGAPFFDRYMPYLNNHPKVNSDIKRVLVITTNAPLGLAYGEFDMPELFITSVIDSLKKIKNIEIIIKTHPAESVEYYQNLLKNYNCGNAAISRNSNLPELLQQSDLIISAGSTVLFEARIFKKPIIYFRQGKILLPAPLDEKSGLCVVTNTDELEDWSKKLLSGEISADISHKAIDEYIGPIDGRCTGRVMEVIDKICQAK
jgi:hypothetical protein